MSHDLYSRTVTARESQREEGRDKVESTSPGAIESVTEIFLNIFCLLSVLSLCL